MKKNITINLFGVLYAIDEDAYELLKKYEENMRAYFRTKEGGEEIADDIEHRVAELLAELKEGGAAAVSIEDVEQIIRRIGNPEEMDDAAAPEAAGTDAEGEEAGEEEGPAGNLWERLGRWTGGRKLFRDPDDVVVGGVMSGLCRYFGGTEPLPWRIGMVLLCFFSFSTFAIVYLILWAIVPQALTVGEKLQMQGRPVNPQTVSEELVRPAAAERTRPGRTGSAGRRGPVRNLFSLVLLCVKLVACVALVSFLFLAIGCMVMLSYVSIYGADTLVQAHMFDPELMECLNIVPGISWKLWTFFLSGLVVLGIPLAALVSGLLGKRADAPASSARRFTLVAVWFCALVVAFVAGFSIIIGGRYGISLLDTRRNTENGIYLDSSSRNILKENGWTLLKFENCNPNGCFYQAHEFVEGEWWRYMDIYNGGREKPMKFRVKRSLVMPAGKYCVEALMRSNGNGCCLYLKSGKDGEAQMVLGEAPVGTGPKGNIARMTPEEGRSIYCFTAVPDSAAWAAVQGRAEDWNYVCSDTLVHGGGALEYGVSNDVDFTSRPWNGTHFGVSMVQLRQVGDR